MPSVLATAASACRLQAAVFLPFAAVIYTFVPAGGMRARLPPPGAASIASPATAMTVNHWHRAFHIVHVIVAALYLTMNNLDMFLWLP